MISQQNSPSDERGRQEALDLLEREQVDLLRLQFSDLPGSLRYLDVPARQIRAALEGAALFDGSIVGGAFHLEEADMRLRPDTGTLALLPSSLGGGRVAAMICDIERGDGTPFEGDSRAVLRRAIVAMEEAGYRPEASAEIEFYLLPAGAATGGPASGSNGGTVRQEIVGVLEGWGIAVASSHAQTAPGQHEIRLLPAGALQAADQLARLKAVARSVAEMHGLRAVFMPKPVYGLHGSGLHLHHRLVREGSNAFFDPEALDGLSDVLRAFVGGILRHARAFAAITNPLVNSYKRLVPGYAAPLYATWSLHDRTPLVRVPPGREQETRCEVRLADPASNPYLALAVQLAAGLEGIGTEADPGAPVSKKLGMLGERELQRRKIASMPQHLGDALHALEESRVVRSALGEYVFSHHVEAKGAEWREYVAQVHAWELARYLEV